MVLVVIGVPIVVLIFTLDVVALAIYLKCTKRPYAFAWSARFVHGAVMLKNACYLLFLFLVWAAFLLMFPVLFGWSNSHAIALWGSIDLLSAIVLYGLWKWVERLVCLATLNVAHT